MPESEEAVSSTVFTSEVPDEELASCGEAEPEPPGSDVICVQPEKSRLRASKTKILLFKIYIHLSEYQILFRECSRYSEGIGRHQVDRLETVYDLVVAPSNLGKTYG